MAQYQTKSHVWGRAGISVSQAASLGSLLSQTTFQNASISNQSGLNAGLGTGTMILSQQQSPQVAYNTALGMQQNAALQQTSVLAQVQNAVALPSSLTTPGVALPTSLSTNVGQINAVTYPTARTLQPSAFAQQQSTLTQVQNQVQQQKQRVFTGVVTKFHDNFGFVDEDVFFQIGCVKGALPKVGDRVLVEAVYNANMPFKWNATRIQVLRLSQMLNSQQNYGSTSYSAVPPPEQNQNFRHPPLRKTSPIRRERGRDRKEERIIKEKRERSHSPQKCSRSPNTRSRSPPRHRARIVPRYMVQIPKIPLDMLELNLLEVKRRYSNLYIPSDFFHGVLKWQNCFPMFSPLSLSHACAFHIYNKDTINLAKETPLLDPPDADYLFSAKVMLMALPPIEELYKRSCNLAENLIDARENHVHPTRLISFLVGLKGKSETMAIGGPWSPSLDGHNPKEDPSILIRTAIRTCCALTGIDLSHCTQWYRFLEIYYRRGRQGSPRVETVVIFLPDVWSCLPTHLEWQAICSRQNENPMVQPLSDNLDDEKEDPADTMEPCENHEPTHHSELDPKIMKLADLRKELETRGLNAKGLKSQLIARLSRALQSETSKDVTSEVDFNSDGLLDEEEENKIEGEIQDKAISNPVFPDSPHILVYPSSTAKNGKFDCTVMSLSVLLDYRQEDNKEHSFEVSLFAEQFNEMLTRDFSFNIYQALVDAPDRTKEENKFEKKKKEKKEKKENKTVEKDDDDDDDDDDTDERISAVDRPLKKKERPKQCTVDPHLLLSFIYFDQNHCGYIFDKDLEDILCILGLRLSRAQIKRLVQKVIGRDTLNYRKLTDRNKTNNNEEEEFNTHCLCHISKEELARGNNHLLPNFINYAIKEYNQGQLDHGGMIMFRGSLLDVDKLQQQLERTDKARYNTEKKLKELQEQLDTLQNDFSKMEASNQKLNQDLKECKCKLSTTEDVLNSSKSLCSKLEGGLRSVFHIVSPLLESHDREKDKENEYDSDVKK